MTPAERAEIEALAESYVASQRVYRARRRLGRWESLARYLLRWWQA